MSYRFDIDNEDEFLLFSCCLLLHLLKMQLWNTLRPDAQPSHAVDDLLRHRGQAVSVGDVLELE